MEYLPFVPVAAEMQQYLKVFSRSIPEMLEAGDVVPCETLVFFEHLFCCHYFLFLFLSVLPEWTFGHLVLSLFWSLTPLPLEIPSFAISYLSSLLAVIQK